MANVVTIGFLEIPKGFMRGDQDPKAVLLVSVMPIFQRLPGHLGHLQIYAISGTPSGSNGGMCWNSYIISEDIRAPGEPWEILRDPATDYVLLTVTCSTSF